ncbi:MAG: hypothetical protein JNL43_06310 [Flavobacteriales bacterium]|nr:hypothetical protein [Flavobacteriales bacterium]HRH68761.1 hypothetical protein [Flavobacteriales bacterium]
MRTLLPCLLAATLLAFTSCRKDKDDKVVDLDYTSATDNAKADDAFTDMLSQVDKAIDANGLRELCDPTVTFDTIAMPHTMTVDFGAVNCTAGNGRQRRGRIEVSYTGRYREPGTVITITPQGYFVNDNLVQGTKTVTNQGPDGNGHLRYAIVVNGSLTAADGSWTATHQAQRTRTWIEGSDTPELLDDVYLITGSGSGVNRNGAAYTVAITSALRVALSCAWITQGTVQVTPANRPVRTIDYGPGTCDGSFSVNVNGQTFTVNIG